MNFNLREAVEVLERTPRTLEQWLTGLSDGWLQCREGEGTWNAVEVVEHLIEADKVNWIPRLAFILSEGDGKPFPAFDRYAHLKAPERTMERRLQEFHAVRSASIAKLSELFDPDLHAGMTGLHPAFGPVKATELLSAWVVHDMTHIAQIVRIMARRYGEDSGPFRSYLSILK